MSQSIPKKSNFEYKMLFMSIIPPHYATSINVFATSDYQNNSILPNKYYIKYSYLVLAWFFYLKSITSTERLGGGFKSHKKLVKFFILPIKTNNYTLLKAPMAHKKNSKEQFVFKTYYICSTFRGETVDQMQVPSCNAAITLLYIIQKLFPVLSTNLLFLKSSTTGFTYSDNLFFNYHFFTTTIKLL